MRKVLENQWWEKTKLNNPLFIGEAFERVGIYLMGPLSEIKNGNKFHNTHRYLTKFIEVAAIREKSTENVANFNYEKVIMNHGCPNTILPDNGKKFHNNMITKLF